MESFFPHIQINLLSLETMTYLFYFSLFIYVSYIYQTENTIKVLPYKNDLLNVDLIKGEVRYALQDSKNSKFFFFPAMWALISIMIMNHAFIRIESQKWVFDILAILLFIQNYFHYDFILSIAEEKESNPEKSLDEIIKEKEWKVIRENISSNKNIFKL